MKILIGTSGWTYDHWKGNFYPAHLPKKAWFDYYASHFSSVEVNATFYRSFPDRVYHHWRERSPDGFGYVLKAPRLITHLKHLVEVEDDIRKFSRSAQLLQEKFEMILLQIAPDSDYDPDRLKRALLAFPEPHKVTVEFRSNVWVNNEIEELLRELGVTLCDVDSPDHRINGRITSRLAYFRLHGRENWYTYQYSHEDLSEIAGRVKNLAEKEVDRIYIFFNNDYNGYAPENALTLKTMLQDSTLSDVAETHPKNG